MKQSVILQIVVVLLVLHDFFYLPFSPFILTLAAAAAAYGMMNSLVIPAAILFAAPIIHMLLKLMKKTDHFQDKGAAAVAERLKGIAQKTAPSTAYDASGALTTGVLGSPLIEHFQTVDASGAELPEGMPNGMPEGMPGVSIPAYVREKGRMIVVPETSMARLESVDSNPRPSPALIMGEDGASVGTALASDATQLPEADQQAVTASMAAGPVSTYA